LTAGVFAAHVWATYKFTGKERDAESNRKPGVKTPNNQLQRHHKKAASKGGSDKPRNGEILCPSCHKEKHKTK
jgi:hypothetical protein